MSVSVASIEDLQGVVRSSTALLPVGGGTKSALLCVPADFVKVDLLGLAGVVAHQPSEYTVVVRAGTPLGDLRAQLADAGQYLPFDPLFVDDGATVGGVVASGLCGSGRVRYGGIRDFILAVQLVDGRGRVVRGGCNVVKNAAGFDLPKLLVGSLGCFGVLTEVTFKVFPEPPSRLTLRRRCANLSEALEALQVARRSPFQVDAAEIDVELSLWLRLAGLAVDERGDRLATALKGCETVEGSAAAAFWAQRLHPRLASSESVLAKVPLTPGRILAFDEAVTGFSPSRHYSAAGQQAWIDLESTDVRQLDRVLQQQGLRGLVVLGECDAPLLGEALDAELLRRIRMALDPDGRFRSLDLVSAAAPAAPARGGSD